MDTVSYKGILILLDSDCLPLLYGRDWYFCNGRYFNDGNGMALHRAVMGIGPGDKRHVDHINGNTLDNRRINLRFATRHENSRNQRINAGRTRMGLPVTSPYKGVSYDKSKRKYRACITINGRNYKLGTFADEVSAAKAYNDSAKLHFGEFAKLNDV